MAAFPSALDILDIALGKVMVEVQSRPIVVRNTVPGQDIVLAVSVGFPQLELAESVSEVWTRTVEIDMLADPTG